MSLEIDKERLLEQLFSICDKSKVKGVWVVGSVVESLDSEFDVDSDIDMYISVEREDDKSVVEKQVSGRPKIKFVEDGGTIVRELDVHCVFSPTESPGGARGRPVKKIHYSRD
jgi:predicted nucleotidyltransferase